MLKIEAVVRSSRLESIKRELAKIGIITFSTYEVKLSGLSHAIMSNKPGAYKTSALIPKTKIEVVCKDRDKDTILNAIMSGGKTGMTGDGIIYVCPISQIVKIKNRKIGDEAV
jgi:nitrogen regulatory protein P-II 1